MRILQKNPPGATGGWAQLVEKNNGDLVVQVFDATGRLCHEQPARVPAPPSAGSITAAVLTPAFGSSTAAGPAPSKRQRTYGLHSAIGFYSGDDYWI